MREDFPNMSLAEMGSQLSMPPTSVRMNIGRFEVLVVVGLYIQIRLKRLRKNFPRESVVVVGLVEIKANIA